MKKIVLTLALAAFAFAANAQFVIGGQIGFNTDGGNTWNRYTAAGTTPTEYIIPHDSYTDFVFAPKFGYNLNEKMHVGITLGFTSEVHKDYSSNYAGLYRTYKDGVSDEQVENLKWKIYNGKATRADITRLTRRLGDERVDVEGDFLRPGTDGGQDGEQEEEGQDSTHGISGTGRPRRRSA